MALLSLLIIDSTQPKLRMAFWQPSSLTEKTGELPYDASSHFFTYLDEIVPAGKPLDAVVGITGPGSFTSLRTGLSALHGIALAKNIPAIGISAFEAYQASHIVTEKTLILIESQRDEHYAQFCEASTLLDQPFLCSLDEAKSYNTPLIGSAIDPDDLIDLNQVGLTTAEILMAKRENEFPLMPLYGVNAHTS